MQAKAQFGEGDFEQVLDQPPPSFFENKSIGEVEKVAAEMSAAKNGSIADEEDAAKRGPVPSVTCSNATNKDLARLYRDDDNLSKGKLYVQEH